VERSGQWDVFYLPWIEAHKFSRNLANHLKILGDRKLTPNKFHTEDPQILEATIKKIPSTRRRGAKGIVYPCISIVM
jgi:hypothetical protein